jgi:CPA1 family monovalent cation:H+ antiporter
VAVEISFFVLLMVASAVALVAKRARLPYTVALVTAGLALGAADPHTEWLDLERTHLTPELLFNVFLPLLLFEAAFHLSWPKFRENLRAILLLAAPGVVAAVALGGLFSFWLEPLVGPGLPLTVALLLSSVLAATDPVSVIALFKELGVPKRLAVVMEGESLLNDAVGVVAFTVVGALLGLGDASEAVTPLWVARFLLWEIGVGVIAGASVGLAVSWATTLVDDHLIEIMLTTVAAFGSYLVATALHASPVLAVVAAGMACGNVGARFGMTPSNRIAVESFWEYAVFVANGFVFLLVGREIDLGRMIAHAPEIALAWLALTAARALVIALVERVLSRSREKIPARWAAVLTWGGLRGSLSMVLALSLPGSFEHRGLVVDLTFGVVLLSILVQGPTMVPVLRWAGALAGGEAHLEYDKVRTGLHAVRAALRRLDEQRAAGAIHDSTFETLRARLGGREAELEERLDHLGVAAEARNAELERVELELRDVEHAVIREAEERGMLDARSAAQLIESLRTPHDPETGAADEDADGGAAPRAEPAEPEPPPTDPGRS